MSRNWKKDRAIFSAQSSYTYEESNVHVTSFLKKRNIYIHNMKGKYFLIKIVSSVFSQWMCPGLSTCCSSSGHSYTEGEIWRRVWGGCSTLQVDGLLFQRSSFVCGKGCHDWICQTTHSRTGSELQPQRTQPQTGHGGGYTKRLTPILRLHNTRHYWLLCLWQFAGNW